MMMRLSNNRRSILPNEDILILLDIEVIGVLPQIPFPYTSLLVMRELSLTKSTLRSNVSGLVESSRCRNGDGE
jgi:hypothetical protein